ncbi:unnamed protein product [Onchocerca flexuosa]|uniref:ATPase_AAA_core domain-containing protein n=1 Tax=Onchocerca flexuosa TaxID=387005 RepID=A0A183H519_9BILA|nr:unnamed protein product [Onchocerca flexuosa]
MLHRKHNQESKSEELFSVRTPVNMLCEGIPRSSKSKLDLLLGKLDFPKARKHVQKQQGKGPEVFVKPPGILLEAGSKFPDLGGYCWLYLSVASITTILSTCSSCDKSLRTSKFHIQKSSGEIVVGVDKRC